jgi:hypothetical protein
VYRCSILFSDESQVTKKVKRLIKGSMKFEVVTLINSARMKVFLNNV